MLVLKHMPENLRWSWAKSKEIPPLNNEHMKFDGSCRYIVGYKKQACSTVLNGIITGPNCFFRSENF